jgi:hypothetical protein
LLEQTFRPHYVGPMGMLEAHFNIVSRVAACCRCASLSGYRGVDALADTLSNIIEERL